MKRQRSREPSTSSTSKRTKSTSQSDSSPPNIKVKKYLASLPTHGELTLDSHVTKLPGLASAVITEIKQSLASVRKQKKTASQEKNERIRPESKKKILVALQFLKKLNRLSQLHCKEHKDTTQKVKGELDEIYLQLQNLTYEYNHLLRETANCLEFKSQHEDLDLVTVKEFYKKAPQSISLPEETQNNEHRQMLARLEWELKERERLDTLKGSLLKELSSLKEDILSRQEKLDSLEPSLNTLLKAAQPVQDILGLSLNQDQIEMKAAKMLPFPLYILFLQAKGCADNYSSLSVNVVGDFEEAESWLIQSSSQNEEESEQEQEQDEESDRKQHKKKSKTHSIKPFPLKVKLTIEEPGEGTVPIVFTYLEQLKTVCIATDNWDLKTAMESTIDKAMLFKYLQPGDSGTAVPYLAENYFQKHSKESFSDIIHRHGYPYEWVHKICGIEFLSKKTEKEMEQQGASDSDQIHFEVILKALVERVHTQLLLCKQIKQLDQLVLNVTEQDDHLFPSKVHSKLVRWQRITEKLDTVLQQFPSAAIFNSIEHLGGFYLAKFQNQQVSPLSSLHCAVCIPASYPKQPPTLALLVESGGNKLPFSLETKDLEKELNLGFHDLIKDDASGSKLLLRQLLKAQVCFDVYHTCHEKLPEGPLGKAALPVKYRGPTKTFPYKYCAATGQFLH